MSKLGRIGTCISLDIETTSMFNDLKMQGVNMSESIRDHIRWLYASRMGQEPKSWVEHHWESLQDDKREYEDALNKILLQEDRFVANLPRNIAMHEKSQALISNIEKHRWGRLLRLRKIIELQNIEDRTFEQEMDLSRKKSDLNEIVSNWNELEWGSKPDIRTDEGCDKILKELDDIERKRFLRKASIEQIEIQLEADGDIPDLISTSITNMMLPSGDEL